MKSAKLFLALGLATTLGLSGTAIVNADESKEVSNFLMAEGGEGGEGETKLSPGELLSELQNGGYVIYFRHAQTETDYADQTKADVNDCATQRVLSEEGWQQAISIGDAFDAAQIPIGEVTTSEYCRAWETASLAFGQYQKDSALNFLPFEDYTDEQVEQMKANVTPFLTTVPENGTNNIIVGHDDIFEAATGIYPDPQGMAYVLKPDSNGGFEVIANMLSEEWTEL